MSTTAFFEAVDNDRYEIIFRKGIRNTVGMTPLSVEFGLQ